MTVSMPKAPPLPMFVVLRQWAGAIIVIDGNTPIEDVLEETGPDWIEVPEEHSSITLWNYNAPFALLPYIDLPHEILDKRGMAVITADGRRGWVIYDMAISPMSSVAIEPEECPDFIASLEDNNWEVIPITRKDVDLDKHFTKRGDDGDYDMTAGVLWDGPSCNWCGHPRLKHDDDPLDGTHPCEACGANPDDPEGGIRLDASKPFPAHQTEEWQ